MEKYDITGMACAACSARIEKKISGLKGVDYCAVNLLANSMTVDGTASEEQIVSAVKSIGYGASLASRIETPKRDDTYKAESRKILRRLAVSLSFLAVLMYFSMGGMIGLPQPGVLTGGVIQAVLALCVIIVNRRYFISGTKGLIHFSPNMDTLIAIGSGAAFLYSTYILITSLATGEKAGDFYFESAAMAITLVTLGKFLEARSKGKTTNAVNALIDLTPKTANVIRDGEEICIPAAELAEGDIFAIRSGESIPTDGEILKGNGSIDESALTGESVPADKAEGEKVFAGTIIKAGYFECRATRTAENTTLSKIIRLVEDASSGKAPISKTADKVAAVFVPCVMIIALITFIIWLAIGASFADALTRGICVLVISCPCALGLATPVAVTAGSGTGAKLGILFKTAAAIEETGRAQIAVLDKTGTVTEGKPSVTDIIPVENESENDLLSDAFALEKMSEHPISRAIIDCCIEREIETKEIDGFTVEPGKGLKGRLNGAPLRAGNSSYISEIASIPDELISRANAFASQGKTVIWVSKEAKLLGMIAVSDTVKRDSAEAIDRLKAMGLKTVLLTGDKKETAAAVAEATGIDTVISEVLPDDKESRISAMRKEGKVVMIGDGINDAPALASADVGMAIGAGTDIAIDSADAVLMNSSLNDAATAVKLGKAVLKIIKQNLFWAFLYNSICIPLAAGVFIPFTGWELSPAIGAAAMSLSSFFVVTNALRLNRFKAFE
ncbi:MAG: heavy metal translocating P-type ATPase [Clostridia bacterium]|nr:heavy metal translocating P-type ATPase [Clostridia bacterium]